MATENDASTAISAASPAASRHPFLGCPAPHLDFHRQFADLALGLPQLAVILRQRASAALERLLAAGEEIVPPGRDAVGFHPELTARGAELLALQKAQDYIQLLAR
ncbi:MAG: hypothetical protein M3179_10205 [Actinomycetota bacterium]|nr:hypothetical protein [Actinomycetota bacterium]